MTFSICHKLDLLHLPCVNELFKFPLQRIIRVTPTLVEPDISCHAWLKTEMESGVVLTAENSVFSVLPVICCHSRYVEEEAMRK